MTEDLARIWLQEEGLAGVEEEIDAADEMYATLCRHDPPAAARVAYFRTGWETLRIVRALVAACGLEGGRILDFACGWGRTTRYLVREFGADAVDASDIAAEAVRFVARTFHVRAFASHTDPARVAIPAEYDLIWVGSLFSHLPRQPFAAWLRRLSRQLSPRGVLAFTTLGPDMIAGGTGPDGFRFEPISETERLSKAEYGNTNVHPSFVERELSRLGLVPLAHRPRALWRSQDLFVAGRPDRDALAADWCAPPTVRGTLVGPRALGGGHGRLEGVVGVSGAEEVEAVFLRTAHRDLGEAWRGPAYRAPEGDGLLRDWFLEGPLDVLGPPPLQVAARARLRGGEQQTFAVAAIE